VHPKTIFRLALSNNQTSMCKPAHIEYGQSTGVIVYHALQAASQIILFNNASYSESLHVYQSGD